MRGTDGRTTVTLSIEGEDAGDTDVIRSFEIEKIAQTDAGQWILIDDDARPRLVLRDDEMQDIGAGMHGGRVGGVDR